MTSIYKLFVNPQRISEDYIKKFCFLNNVRSKYLTVFLICCSFLFSFYDIFILQKTADYKVFLIHFKTDIIFLVFSFIFTLYIFFNQVKTYKKIQGHHRYIHGIISLFILLWSVFKSIILIKYNNGNFNIAIIGILLTSFLYVLPVLIYISQLILAIVFEIIISLLFNFTVKEIIHDIFLISILCIISLIISRYIFSLHFRIMIKETEVNNYREKNNFIIKN